MLLSAFYLNPDTLKNNKWILVFPSLIYILGHLTRLKSGYLGFGFGLAFSLLFISTQKQIRPFLLKFVLPVVAFILIAMAADIFSQKTDPRNNYYLEKSEIAIQFFDYQNISAYVPENIKDKIAYAAMQRMYLNDDKIMSLDLLKKLIDTDPLLLKKGRNARLKNKLGEFTKSLSEENSISRNLNISFFLVLVFWLLTSFKENLVPFLKYTGFQLFFIAAVVGISYFMKMPARISSPLLTILTISNILLISSTLPFEKKQFYYVAYSLLIVSLYASPEYCKANTSLIFNYREYGKINHMIFDDMNNRFRDTIFIPTNLRSWEMHNATDPIKEINLKNNNCYLYLSINLSIAPETQDQLLAKFGTFDHAVLFKKISKMNNVIFISDSDYNNFLGLYYHYLYNQDFYFEEVFKDAPSLYNTGLKYYRLKELRIK